MGVLGINQPVLCVESMFRLVCVPAAALLLQTLFLSALSLPVIPQNDLLDENIRVLESVPFETDFYEVYNNDEYKGDLFYWYIPYNNKVSYPSDEDVPVLLWMSGGPGCSSSVAAFSENGPWTFEDDGRLIINEHGWNNFANVIYVDQPLGTGYSYVHDQNDYVTNEAQIAADMHGLLSDFFLKHPDLKERPFYIVGESYAGHYIPHLADYILKLPIEGVTLTGIGLGNAFVYPLMEYRYLPDYLLEVEMIDRLRWLALKVKFIPCWLTLKQQIFTDDTVDRCFRFNHECLENFDVNPYDIRRKCADGHCYDFGHIESFLSNEEVLKLIHAKLSKHFDFHLCDGTVFDRLVSDLLKNNLDVLSNVVNQGVKTVVYNGDKDTVCHWKGELEAMYSMDWKHRFEFNEEEISDVFLNGNKIAEITEFDPLIFLKVLDAGHMSPMDQPVNVNHLIMKYLLSLPQ